MGLARPRSVGGSARGTSRGRRDGLDAAPDAHATVDEALLADLRHDSRNLFHKIHYCVEVLCGEDDGPSGRSEAARMLVRSVGSLERLVGGTLDCLAPFKIEAIRMTGRDVAMAVESVLAGQGSEPVAVTVDAKVQRVTLDLDPGRVSAALRAIAARHVPDTALVGLAVEPGPGSLEIRVERRGPACIGSEGGGHASLEWASVARTVAAHGGRLLPIESSGRVVGCIITLPLVQEAAGGTSRER